MRKGAFDRRLRNGAVVSAAILSLFGSQTGFAQPLGDNGTTTPIKHVIVIIGENRTFDHVFATYQPVNKGDDRLEPAVGRDRQAGRFAGPQLWQSPAISGLRHHDLSAGAAQGALCDPAARPGRRSGDALRLRSPRGRRRGRHATRRTTKRRPPSSRTACPTTMSSIF